MALPGNGTILAVSKEREALYDRAARAIIQLVESDLKPRDIATIEAWDNAIMLDVAMGGSTNTILHSLAIAREAGIEYDIARIDAISRRIPCLCKVSPSSNYHVQDVHRAGGIHTILGELNRMGALEPALQDCDRQDDWREHRRMGRSFGELHAHGRVPPVSPAPPHWSLIPTTSWAPPRAPPVATSRQSLCSFCPPTPRAITLWRLAAAFNAGDAAAAACLFTEDAEFQVDETLSWKGKAEIEAGLKGKFDEFKGLVRAELGQLKGTPVLVLWQYSKGDEKKMKCLLRTGRLRGWEISKAYHEYRAPQLEEVQPSGLMPYDSAFMFDAQDCIRTKETAYSPEGGLSILYGQLAPEGSVVKTAGISEEFKMNCGPGFVFEGPCIIFESQDDACAGILDGKAKAGDVVIIRNEGPRGGPGMQEMLSPTSYIVGMGLGDKCALITDGRFSGGTAGACIGHVSPEAAEGGPIGLLKEGDRIRIDFPNRRMDILVPEAELAERKRTWQPVKRDLTGWLARYQKLVTNASQGAILTA